MRRAVRYRIWLARSKLDRLFDTALNGWIVCLIVELCCRSAARCMRPWLDTGCAVTIRC